jgi:hypothetical protein
MGCNVDLFSIDVLTRPVSNLSIMLLATTAVEDQLVSNKGCSQTMNAVCTHNYVTLMYIGSIHKDLVDARLRFLLLKWGLDTMN